ncbi:MAG: hypothetical protein EOO61_18955 [Hymenobacter sp.]|nr:MAG: hypothetical protein EOO61_18955 [Hymenobacter sp.]
MYSPDINKLEVYRMFIRLAVLGYIQLDSFGELIPGRKQEVLYTLAQKGKETVANYTQPTLLDDFIASLSIEQNERSIASISATTIRLKNFLLYL